MVTHTQRGQYTYADYLQTPEDVRCELINGELIQLETPPIRHQQVVMRFMMRMGPFIHDNGLGEIFPPCTDVFLSDINVLQPDLLFISTARLGIIGEPNVQGPPDLVVEVASPSTRERDRGIKQELYARFGVREYWQADPESRTVAVLRLEAGRFVSEGVYGLADALTTPLLPGLAIDLREVFR